MEGSAEAHCNIYTIYVNNLKIIDYRKGSYESFSFISHLTDNTTGKMLLEEDLS